MWAHRGRQERICLFADSRVQEFSLYACMQTPEQACAAHSDKCGERVQQAAGPGDGSRKCTADGRCFLKPARLSQPAATVSTFAVMASNGALSLAPLPLATPPQEQVLGRCPWL